MNPPKKPFPWAATLLFTLLLIILGFITYGLFMRSAKVEKRTEALNNAKQIHTALISYAQDHEGQFPTGTTVEECLTKLIDANCIDDEKYFYNPLVADRLSLSAIAPNNDGTLTPGETTLGYIEGLNMKSKSDSPILFDSSTSPGIFSTASWNGKAIIAKVNGSVAAIDIEFKGTPLDKNGNPKQGPILEKQEDKNINIFHPKNLPQNTKILLPTRPEQTTSITLPPKPPQHPQTP